LRVIPSRVRKMPIPRTRRKPGKRSNGYVLPPEKLAQREAAFAIYRDMGPRRSLIALGSKLKRDYPEIAVSRPSLEKWSKLHRWAERVAAHDRSSIGAATQQDGAIIDPNFNQIDALLQAANQALTRAMSATPVVTKPSDVKALVDAAANALKLIETIKNQSSGKVSREEIAQEMARVLGEVEKARMRDVEEMVEAELKRRGLAVAGDGQIVMPAAAAGLYAVTIEADEPGTMVEAEQPPAEEKPKNVIAKPAMKMFSDVLKTLAGP
jgi:hypothetical protein